VGESVGDLEGDGVGDITGGPVAITLRSRNSAINTNRRNPLVHI